MLHIIMAMYTASREFLALVESAMVLSAEKQMTVSSNGQHTIIIQVVSRIHMLLPQAHT